MCIQECCKRGILSYQKSVTKQIPSTEVFLLSKYFLTYNTFSGIECNQYFTNHERYGAFVSFQYFLKKLLLMTHCFVEHGQDKAKYHYLIDNKVASSLVN